MKKFVLIDPNEHYPNVEPRRLMAICGYLLPWALDENLDEYPIKVAYEKMYPFGMFPMNGGSIDKDTGVFSYPGDDDMYPVVKVMRGPETIYIYEHAIICWYNAQDELFVTRMD